MKEEFQFESEEINRISARIGGFYRNLMHGAILGDKIIETTETLIDKLDGALDDEATEFKKTIDEFINYYTELILPLDKDDFKTTTHKNATKYSTTGIDKKKSKGLVAIYSRLKLLRKIKKKIISSLRFDKIHGDTKGVRIIRDHPKTPEIDFFYAKKTRSTEYLEEIISKNPKKWQYQKFDVNEYQTEDFEELFTKILDIYQEKYQETNGNIFEIDLVKAYVTKDTAYLKETLTQFEKELELKYAN